MKKTVTMQYKEDFLKVYTNLPLVLRTEVVLVLNDQPVTWNVVFIEVKADTDFGKEMLIKLKHLDFI